MPTADPVLEELWKFVRGDVAGTDFEKWACGERNLEMELGRDLYLVTTSTDYCSEEAVWALRCALAVHARARSPAGCVCLRLKDSDVVDMGDFRAPEPAFEASRSWSDDDVLGNWGRVKTRGSPYWWLWAARCRACGQGWLVAQEERQNDVYCVKRLSDADLQAIVQHDRWPGVFDSYEALLRAGLDAGRSVRWVDPGTSDMRYTIADLAKARPGIAVTELAAVLSLDVATAKELATHAATSDGVKITFDTD